MRGPERERTQPTEGQSWREGGVRQFELGSEGEGNKENGDKERVEENENGSSFKFVSLWEASRRQSQGEDQVRELAKLRDEGHTKVLTLSRMPRRVRGAKKLQRRRTANE